jgi:hypothetical protein
MRIEDLGKVGFPAQGADKQLWRDLVAAHVSACDILSTVIGDGTAIALFAGVDTAPTGSN